ncbi:Adenosine kinase 1, partial [Lamellibrachia satsuma]
SQLPEKVLLGIGNPLLDITVSADEAFLQKYDLESNNAIVADKEKHTALFEDMVTIYKPEYGAGGATQNAIRVAQWLLQQPKVTGFLGCVGNDENAQLLQRAAERDGVYVHYCVDDKEPTGTCGAIITGEDRSLVANLGAAQHLSCNWLVQPDNWALVKKAQFYYIAGFLYQTCPDAVHRIAKHSSENNKTLVMNLSAPALCTYFSDPKINIMSYIDVLFGNGVEAEVFCKQLGIPTGDHTSMALAVTELPKKNQDRSRIVVFTRGPRSTIVARDGKATEYPIKPIDKSTIKDTNGCGDAFVGGFLSQLVLGRPLEECVRCGNYAAHTILQQWGCNYPDLPDF